MSADTWQRVRSEYEAGLEASPEVRAARLAALREAGESELADEVGALWSADGAAGSFLAEAAVVESDPVVGTSIGPYRVLHRLGAGGMGAVYLAARADGEFRRRVALKLLKPGMDSEEIQRRFRFERQILAALDHPNITRLLDGGTTAEGRPYFVLEAVFGEPLDLWGRAQALPERLRLFATICRTVQFAHQNLVVHRDLKPSNILVTADGAPKLVDFGIAKLLNPELGGPTLVATAPVLAPHTPDYASPEQLRGERVTTATDIYSLGLLLAELVTGERPRREAQGELSGPLPAGDLGAIVAKALRPAPADRYPSAAALADDVERFLDGHPVRARKGTTTYRARLFVRRHKVGVAMAATALVALLTFGIGMAALATRLAAEREVAVRERQRAERVTEFVTGIFDAADPTGAISEQLTARDLLERGAASLESSLAAEPQLQAQVRKTVGIIYRRLGLLTTAEGHLQRALEVTQEVFGPRSEEAAGSLNEMGQLRIEQARYAEAEELFRRSLEIAQVGEQNETRLAAEGRHGLGSSLVGLSRFEEAEAEIRTAYAARLALLGELDSATLRSQAVLGVIRFRRDGSAEAERILHAVLEARRQIHGPRHVEVATALNQLALPLQAQRRFTEAEKLHREALEIRRDRLGEGHPRVADSWNNLGFALQHQGRFDEALPCLERAVQIRRTVLGGQHDEVARSLDNLGFVLQSLGRLAEAEAALEESIAIRQRALSPNQLSIADSLRNLAILRFSQGQLESAEKLFTEALERRTRFLGPDHSQVAGVLMDVGIVQVERQRYSVAEVTFRRSLEAFRRGGKEGTPDFEVARGWLARSLFEQSRFEEAEKLLLATWERLSARVGEQSPMTREVAGHLQGLYRKWGRTAEAKRWEGTQAGNPG